MGQRPASARRLGLLHVTRWADHDDGVIAILVAILAVVLFGLGAIVVDLGFARQLKQQAVDSADAASLAAVSDLQSCTRFRCTRATQSAKDSVRLNFDTAAAAWPSCTAVPPQDGNLSNVTWRQRRSGTSCIQYGTQPGQTRPSLVFVALPPRDSGSFLGGALGYRGLTISASTVAGVIPTTAAPCALCVLDTVEADGGAITVTGHGSLYATRGDATPGAITVDPGGIFLTEEPDSVVGFNKRPVVTGQPVLDPFGAKPVPTPDDAEPDVRGCKDDVELLPGTYADGLTVTGPCRLTPGTYAFDGDVDVRAGGVLVGDGVTLVFRHDSGLTVATGGSMSVTGPASAADVVLFAQGSVPLDVEAGAGLTLVGDVYAGDSQLSSPGTTAVLGSLVVKRLTATAGSVAVTSEGTAVPQVGRPDLGLVR